MKKNRKELLQKHHRPKTPSYFISITIWLLIIAFLFICGYSYGYGKPASRETGASRTIKKSKKTLTRSRTATTPSVSYSSPNVYTTGTNIPPLVPNSSGVGVASYSTNSISISGDFARPRAIAVDKGGNVFICDMHWGVIYEVPFGGGATTTVASGFNNPTGVAVDDQDNLYVADYGNGAIKEVPAGSTAAITLTSSIAQPYAISCDADGNLYIADYGNKAIMKLPAGSSTPFVFASNLNGPLGVTVDRNFNVYIADTNNSAIIEYPYGATSPISVGSGFNDPSAVAVDNGGNIFVADQLNDAAKEIVAGSNTILNIVSGLSYPMGVGTDASGDVYVADYGSGVVKEIQPVGGYYCFPALPRGITFDTSTGIFAGIPGAASPAANYVVTAYNGASTTTATINITVNLAPPANFSYAGPKTYIAGTTIAPLTPAGGAGVQPPTYNAPINAITGITNPFSVCPDAAGDFFITNGTNIVIKIPANGQANQGLGSGFNVPVDAKVDASGNIYVADYSNNAVKEILASDNSITTRGTGFTGPRGLALDAADNIYVAGYGDHTVKEILSGTNITVTLASTFSQPIAVAVDANGYVYVVDRGAQNLQRIPPGGGTPVILASGYTNPYSVAVDASGNIFVADRDAGVIQELQAGGGVTDIASGLSSPDGLSIDTHGNLLIAGYGDNTIKKMIPGGGFYISPLLPQGLGFNAANGAITGTPRKPSANTAYLVSAYNSGGGNSATVSIEVDNPPAVSIRYASPQNYAINTAITPLTPTAAGVAAPGYNIISTTIASGFSSPTGVAVDVSGNVYVADATANEVKKIPAGGGSEVVIGSGFNTPFGVAVDAAGDVYVADQGNNAVKEIPVGGGTPVTIGSGFSLPTGVAIDAAGNIYVADYANNAIKKIPVGSNTPVAIGTGFNHPVGIAADAAGDVFVGDNDNNVVKEIFANGSTSTIGTGFSHPYGVAVDNGGNVYVADNFNGAVKVIAPGGVISTIGSGFNNPEGVAIDVNGNVWVADDGNKLLKEVTPVGGYFISPALPAGLAFNGVTGAISGTPTKLTAAANYSVTAWNNYTTGNAVVNIAISNAVANTNLSVLKISAGALSPVFAPGTTSYSVAVGNGTSSITVTPTTADPAATVKVNGTAVSPGSASAAINLNVGVNTIHVVVTGSDGTSTKTYTITVTRAASADAYLSNLKINAATLSPAFAFKTLSYTSSVPNTTSSVTVTPTLIDATASIKVNGTTVANKTASGPIALVPGANTINIVVTAQDGITKQTYTIAVGRGSNDAYLSNLKVTTATLSPAFAYKTLTYTANVPNGTTSVTVTPSLVDATASSLKVNGITVANKAASGQIALALGSNTVNVVIIAQDGVTTQTYTLTINRALSSNDNLANLGLSAGTLSPVFASGTTSYTASVAESVANIKVTPTTADPTGTITVNGIAVASGAASAPITLNTGTNTINIIVTAQDGVTKKTYTLKAGKGSNDAYLSNLKVTTATLTPAFAFKTLAYTSSVPNGTSSVTVTPSLVDATASSLTINGTPVVSKTASGAIALSVGANNINIKIIAQDGVTTESYTVTITRAASGMDAYTPIAIGTIGVTKPAETPQLAEDGVLVHQGVSPNGDGINDFLQIDNISQYPDNKLSIMNRNGQLVFEAKGYDNSSKVFDGHSNKNGQMQLPGTYFYQLDYAVSGITRHKTGFIVLKY